MAEKIDSWVKSVKKKKKKKKYNASKHTYFSSMDNILNAFCFLPLLLSLPIFYEFSQKGILSKHISERIK